MSDFDERSGIVPCKTPWGRWWQTMEDVTVEVNLNECCKTKEITCVIKPRLLKLTVKGTVIFEVSLASTCVA